MPPFQQSTLRLERYWELVDRLASDMGGSGHGRRPQPPNRLDILEAWLDPDTDSPSIARLPILTCRATGGEDYRATPLAVAWQAVRMAVKLLDDAEDGDVEGDPGPVINTGTAVLFVAQMALDELSATDTTPDRVQAVRQGLNEAMLRACVGQQADLMARHRGSPSVDPDTWLKIAGGKSGELLGWAAWAGAIVGGAGERVACAHREYGYCLGVLLQVADDFNGIWDPHGVSDLASGCLSLPVCYGLEVTIGEERVYLLGLLERAANEDTAAEAQARQLLTNLGAQAYLLAAAKIQYEQAMAALARTADDRPSHQALISLLDRILPALATFCQKG